MAWEPIALLEITGREIEEEDPALFDMASILNLNRTCSFLPSLVVRTTITNVDWVWFYRFV